MYRLTTGLLAFAGFLLSQTSGGGQLRIAFRDPSRPGTVKITAVRGNLTVREHDGTDVIVEGVDPKAPAVKDGLRRVLGSGSVSAALDEDNNVIKISNGGYRTDLDIRVPAKATLRIQAVHGRSVVVEGVDGDIEATNVHGSITLRDVAGGLVADTVHGSLKVQMRAVPGGKPTRFSSVHGSIDLTLPPETKADLDLRTSRGAIYSDFDVTLGPESPQPQATKNNDRGRYRISSRPSRTAATAKINGGGEKMVFRTVHGDVMIRKAK